MKLNNQQIDAIVNEQYKKHREKVDAEYAKNKKAKDVIEKANKLDKIYKSLSPEFKEAHPYTFNNKPDYVSFYAKKVSKLPDFSRESLKNDIIMLSIDSKDLAELKSKLGI